MKYENVFVLLLFFLQSHDDCKYDIHWDIWNGNNGAVLPRLKLLY